jgi:hypothetical protein
MPIHDIRCLECEYIEPDVFVVVGQLPSCSICGYPTKIDWSHGKGPAVRGQGYGSFTPIDMGVLGKAETKEDYDRAVSVIQQRFPGHRIELESESKSKKQERIDAIRQRSYEVKKQRGLTENELRQRSNEAVAEKEGKATKIMSKPAVSA